MRADPTCRADPTGRLCSRRHFLACSTAAAGLAISPALRAQPAPAASPAATSSAATTGAATSGAATAGAVTAGAADPKAALPRGPIALIVPFAVSGATDVVTRYLAKRLSEQLGHVVVVENVGGGGGVLGAQRVVRAPADGSVLLMGTVATHAINPLSTTPRPYDPVADFTPISMVARVPNVLLVHSSVKAENVPELVQWLRAQREPASYGSSGVGTPPHLSGELFRVMADVPMNHIPYRGGGPAMTDLIAGHIPILFDVLTGAAGHIRNGSARALAVTTAERSPSFPDVPTIAENGVPGYETYTWNAVFGPARMSAPLAARLSVAIRESVADPAIQARLTELSAEPLGSTPEALAAHVQAENDKWGRVIESIGGLKRD